VLICLSASTGRAQVAGSDESQIRAARARSNRAIAAHDTAAIANAWLPEFHIVTSVNRQSAGRDAARTAMGDTFVARPDVVYVREPTSITVNAKWGHAAENGRWTGRWTQRDGVTRVGGVYFAKWKKTDAGWKLLSETFVQTSCSGTSYCDAPPR
jgi:ketosteroid isomerase-like protein